MNTQKYIESNKERFLKELFDLLKKPSISADPVYTKAVFETAEMVLESLELSEILLNTYHLTLILLFHHLCRLKNKWLVG